MRGMPGWRKSVLGEKMVEGEPDRSWGQREQTGVLGSEKHSGNTRRLVCSENRLESEEWDSLLWDNRAS